MTASTAAVATDRPVVDTRSEVEAPRFQAWIVFYRPGARPHSPLGILIVEDDVAIAEMYRIQLETDGFAVSIAPDSDAALALLATSKPDIILLDVMLPGKSGFEVLEDLQSNGQQDRLVVFLSNVSDPQLVERGLALGAVDYLVKSRVTPADVSRRIRGWIESTGGSVS